MSRFVVICVTALNILLVSPVFAASEEWNQATALYSGGNYAAALAAFRKISDRAPRDASTHYMIGQCYRGLNKSEQARAEFDWVSKYAPDAKTRVLATGMLAQVLTSGTKPSTQTATSVTAAPVVDDRGVNGFVNDSPEQTIRSFAKRGLVPCRGGCLNVATPGWSHKEVDGHPDTDMWMTYAHAGGSRYYSQNHIGHIIQEFPDKNAEDVGSCPKCGGTGWVKAQ